MARQESQAHGPGGEWLAAQSARRPEAVTRAQRLMAAGGRSNDAVQHGRQYLERAFGADPEASFTRADYEFAGDWLYGAGRQAHGEVMESIAAVDGELRAAWPSWRHRYDGRPLTAAERGAEEQLRTGQVVERSRPGHGIDGGWYGAAWYPRTGQPAVVVTTSALTREVIPFGDVAGARAWLDSRSPRSTGPLPATAAGPAASRTAREEELLAWLVRSPGDTAAAMADLGPAAWTTHLRAELAAALRWSTETGGTPGFGVIAGNFGRRLLRAPGPAAEEIGWPHATRAMTYLQRLASTPVTRQQAREAAHRLATADAAALAMAPSSAPLAPSAPARPARPSPHPVPPVLPPPPVPQPGPVPRR